MAILVQQDPDDPSQSYVFWGVLLLCVVFVVIVVLARIV